MIYDKQAVNQTETVLQAENVDVYYGDFLAVKGIYLKIPKNRVTAFIGPSGCGKSTLLRCYNRLNDLIPIFRLEGLITYHNQNLYGRDILVEKSLRGAALWDEVKDKLRQSGLALSGGQQQRLCIARTIALQPDIVLMDEPCSALDPISTLKIEELIHQLKENYTIVIVTHNMQQASRVADYTGFFNVTEVAGGNRQGYLAEFAPTEQIFQNPQQETTQQYVSGRFG